MIINTLQLFDIKPRTIHRKPQKLTMKTLTYDTVSFTKSSQAKISFKGNKELTRAISDILFLTDFDLKQIVNKYKSDNRVIGNLPVTWLDKIPQPQKSKAEKEIETALGKASRLLNTAVFKLDKDVYEYTNKQLKNIFNIELTLAKNLIAETLLKHNVINNVEDLHLSILGKGGYGTGYFLKVNNEKYCFKVFHNIDNDAFSDDIHGRYIENNRAAFIDKYASGNQYVKFHLGDPYNGFMITDYVDELTTRNIYRMSESLYGFTYEDDSSDNVVVGYNIDYGYIVINNKTLATNETARNIYKTVYGEIPRFRTKVWNEIFEKQDNSEDTNTGLAICINTFGSLTEQLTHLDKIMTLPGNSQAKIAALSTLPSSFDITNYFETIAKTVDKKSIPDLIPFMSYIPEEQALKWFNKFNQNADIDTKIALSMHLSLFSNDEKLAFYDECKQMAKDSPKIQNFLIDITTHIPEDQRLEHYNNIAKHSNNTMIAIMINRLFHLQKQPEKQAFIKSHLDNPSIEVKKALIDKLKHLSIPERFDACEKIFKGANDAIKILLIDEAKTLPVELQREIMYLVQENASPTILDYIDMKS